MVSEYRTRNFYLRCLSTVYVVAFTSLYLQIRGLFGENGVIPVRLEPIRGTIFGEMMKGSPVLLHLAVGTGLSVTHAMELVTLFGILLSLAGMMFQRACNAFLFLTLWLCFLSMQQVGGDLLANQWDSLLLECGFTSVLVAPISYSGPPVITGKDRMTFWLVRWTLFRLYFTTEVIKFNTKSPSWWKLSALKNYYETQGLPSPLAWSIYHWSDSFHRVCQAMTIVMELAVPFLFLAPLRPLRIFSFYSSLLMEVNMMIFGNYGFFNLLRCTMCLSLVDDRHLFGARTVKEPKARKIFCFLLIAVLIYFLTKCFGFAWSPQDGLDVSINFTFRQWQAALRVAIPVSIMYGTWCILCRVLTGFSGVMLDSVSFVQFIRRAIQWIVYVGPTVLLFCITLVPLSNLEKASSDDLPETLRMWSNKFRELHMSSEVQLQQLKVNYGFFLCDGQRREVILEASEQPDGPWITVPFRYKPGYVEQAPLFSLPYDGRLEWQMRKAAIGDPEPWLLSLMYRLLSNESDVINLLSSDIHDEFDGHWPPKYLRASVYVYHFSDPNNRNGDWWLRHYESEHVAASTRASLAKNSLLRKVLPSTQTPVTASTNWVIVAVLDSIWQLFSGMPQHIVLWAILVSTLTIILTTKN